MKRVSFETAKALKEAGYPQENNRICYSEIGNLITISGSTNLELSTDFLAAPTYLEVWLWLWREKGLEILSTGGIVVQGKGKIEVNNLYNYPNDPEEVIITSIEWLVENNLIK